MEALRLWVPELLEPWAAEATGRIGGRAAKP
jgi:hypothetical protein